MQKLAIAALIGVTFAAAPLAAQSTETEISDPFVASQGPALSPMLTIGGLLFTMLVAISSPTATGAG